MCRQVDAMTEEQLKEEFLLVGKIIQHLIRYSLPSLQFDYKGSIVGALLLHEVTPPNHHHCCTSMILFLMSSIMLCFGQGDGRACGSGDTGARSHRLRHSICAARAARPRAGRQPQLR